MMLSTLIRRMCAALLGFVALLVVSSCTQESSVAVSADGDTSVKFGVPSFLNTRQIDPDTLDLTVFINNREVTMNRTPINSDPRQDTWKGFTTVPKGDTAILRVEWNEMLPNGSFLLLARTFNEQVTSINNTTVFTVVENSFQSTGAEFDFDGDGISNLEERKRNLDPFVAQVATGGEPADVHIFGTGGSTEIDGRVRVVEGDNFWSKGTYKDVNDQDLLIDNMIRDDNDALVDDKNPNYQWAAIHDGRYLTIFVYGKTVAGRGRRINGDSELPQWYHHDDSLEIFLDPDLSQYNDDYDAVDDLIINIPLTRGEAPFFEENNSSAPDKRISRGVSVKKEVIFDVQDPALVEFATCFCVSGENERNTWEVRIDLAAAKIPIGRTFGFELQLNIDDNGGERDAKWAWAMPARQQNQTNNDADITWRYPSKMGKAKLIPIGG